MRHLFLAFVLFLVASSTASAARDVGSCSISPASIPSANGSATITVTSNANPFDFYVRDPSGVQAYWPQSGAGTVSYPYPPAADYYPLAVGTYTVVVEAFPGKHGRREIGSCVFTVTP